MSIIQATLKNAKNSGQRTVIYMELNNTQFTICSLITEKVRKNKQLFCDLILNKKKKKLEQQVLNLKVQKGVQIKIWSNGPK
jgi:hypothetical protein